MSYCVNCGVELEKSQKRCPLCNTPVINPNESKEIYTIPPYPYDDTVTVVRKIRRMTVLLISIILLVPFIICPLCNYIISGNLSWSIYVMTSVVLGWFYIVPPILLKHNVVVKCAFIDYISTILFLYMINMKVTPDRSWAEEIALPILTCIMAIILVYAVLVRSFNIHITTYVSLGFVFVAAISIFIEYILMRYNNTSDGFIWSMPVAISCIGVSLLILVISKMTKLKASIRKRMHI